MHPYTHFHPGKIWLDTEGKRIHAHGGSLLYWDNKFYWYGENKEKTVPGSNIWHYGVRLYSSTDLYNWKNEGLILNPVLEGVHPLNPSRIMDRPHIIYNKKTQTFVMWAKFAGTNEKPSEWNIQYMGIATSKTIHGPFELKKEITPCGISSGDFDLIVDNETEAAYIYYEKPHTELICADLTDDYTDVTGKYTSHFEYGAPPFVREAPALFRRKGKLYMLTSGTTGYFPNPTEVAVANDYHGPWTMLGNVCRGDIHHNSFRSQFSSVFQHPHDKDLYIAIGDRWLTDLPENMPDVWKAFEHMFDEKKRDGTALTGDQLGSLTQQNTSLADYVWLPIRFEEDTPYISWEDEWKLAESNSSL